MRKLYLFGLTVGFCSIVLTACQSKEPPAQVKLVSPQEILQAKCTACHSAETFTGQKKSENEWSSTVSRMIKNYQAPISDDEVKVLIPYLTETYGN